MKEPTDGSELVVIVIIVKEVAATVSGVAEEDTEPDAHDRPDRFVRT